jgi:predicted nucleic acid-binding protein
MEGASAQAEATLSAALAYVELRAALAAAIRSGRVPAGSRDSILTDLELAWGDVTVIDVTDSLLRAGGDLAERVRLRAYDAVHLAALLSLGTPPDLIFACWDRELRDAARALGYAIFPDSL